MDHSEKKGLDIVIYAAGMPFNDNTIAEKAIGGSETAAYYQAIGLAQRGHRVSVFTSKRGEDGWRGDPAVGWFYHGDCSEAAPLGDAFEFYTRHSQIDVLIIQRHPLALHHKYSAKVIIMQMHDLATYRAAPAVANGMWQLDMMTGVSDWHCEQLKKVYGTKPSCMWTVPNGVDPSLYLHDIDESDDEQRLDWFAEIAKQNGGPENLPKSPFLMLYQARPERGLEHLVREGGIMERLIGTNAHLIVCGYENTTQQMAPYYHKLMQRCRELPNVTHLGSLVKEDLALLQRSCHIMCYPTEFEEVSCISAMEAMHAGLPLLSSECGALPETCKDAGVYLLPLKDGKADEDAFVAQIKDFMGEGGAEVHASLRHMQFNAAVYKTWNVTVDALENCIAECFKRNTQDSGAVVRHAIAHSDIRFLEWYMRDLPHASRVLEATWSEYERMYAFKDDPQHLQEHYDLHQSKYYDEFQSRVVGEDVTGTTRFLGVANMMEREIKRLGGRARILDYGCAHGHYMMPLAGAFPQCEFHGMDISRRAIAAALEWAIKDKLSNVTLNIGDQTELRSDNDLICPRIMTEIQVEKPFPQGADATALRAEWETKVVPVPQLFDIILAGEVLEHVWDYKELLERFRAVLKPDGLLIVTTPTGRWEWTGTEAFRNAREHLHHFERADIQEICAGHALEISQAAADFDNARGALGSFVWSVRFTPGVEIGEVDYDRKARQLAPRQTISACLIVKNGERTLRKCFDSFVDWVDEVVVGIDPSTTDKTVDILSSIRSEYPLVPFYVFQLDKPVLESGFDAARNATLDAAECQWILWMDADEEVQNPGQLWKYARPSSVDACALSQVHYAADPPAVLTVDHPCRFFRKSSGARFYGLVHEHPEVEVGKAIPFSAVRPDVAFLHSGYVDEGVRRRRYQRNLPLLSRDLEANPNRELNKFLWLRDLAQGMVFELEGSGGRITDSMMERARKGVSLFEEMLPEGNLRMLMDGVEYYSACARISCPRPFEAEFTIRTLNPVAPDLSVSTSVKGVFANVDHYTKLMSRIAQEATAKYEDKYL